MMSGVDSVGSRTVSIGTVHDVAEHLPVWVVLASVASKCGPLGLLEIL